MTIVQLAMTAGLPYTALRDAILAHPTMAEGLSSLFRALPARPDNAATDASHIAHKRTSGPPPNWLPTTA
jgi:hypothetical protein